MSQPSFTTPTELIILGATGDLMSKKIVPALFRLFLAGKLPRALRIIGFARRPFTDEQFRDLVAGMLSSRGIPREGQHVADFMQLFSYHRGQFDDEEAYVRLATLLGRVGNGWSTCSNKLFYLAVPPESFGPIFDHLGSSKLTEGCGSGEGWSRVLVEKPFGKDLPTALALEERLGQLLKEEQIYRIDHYLAKEMIQNMLVFRFANNLFEESWSNKFIEKVEIRLLESIGVEGRGDFYDGLGTLKDVGQNHLLQMLAFATMDHPRSYDPDAIRERRARILDALIPVSAEQAARESYRSQYLGYRDIEGVKPDSQTETYFKLVARLSAPRWQGVPFIMESGKRMGEVRKEIVVTFKHPVPCLCPPGIGHHLQNKIIFSLEPTQAINIQFYSKQPGLDFAVEERQVDFQSHRRATDGQYVAEYEKLLVDAFNGDQTLFVSTEEVKTMWRFIDPIIEAWKQGAVPLTTYRPDTDEASTDAQAIDAAVAASLSRPTITSGNKEVGILGLGKMGGNLARRLISQGYRVVGWNRSTETTHQLEREGMVGAETIHDLVRQLPTPRVVWLMLPAGTVTDEILLGEQGLVRLLAKGDTVIEGGNSRYVDDGRRAAELAKLGIQYLDVGVSGGPHGALTGPSLMIGGERPAFERLEFLFRDLARHDGYQFFDGHGAGHFVKMVHNGIEYGMMQAIAEGFGLMKASAFGLDLQKVVDVYNHGSVIDSRLTQWLAKAFEKRGVDLDGVSSTVAHTGEGAWTVEAAKQMGQPVPVIEDSLEFRKRSAEHPSYIGKVLSALREQFGGHSVNDKK